MDKNDNKRQQQICDTTSAGPPGPVGGTDYLLQPWFRLAAQLIPLIGESGFCALYGRAARLLTPQFEWLTASQSCKSTDQLFLTLGANLGSVETVTASAANTALLTTFTKLLSALIGEALTARLLDPDSGRASEQQNAQEHQ